MQRIPRIIALSLFLDCSLNQSPKSANKLYNSFFKLIIYHQTLLKGFETNQSPYLVYTDRGINPY